MKLGILIIMAILCVLAWCLVAKMIRFDIDLVMHPEEKKLLKLDDMFANKTVAFLFKCVILGSLALLVIFIGLAKELSLFAMDSPLLLITGFVFFFSLFVLSIIEILYALKMLSKNGFMPVFMMLVAFLFSGGFSAYLLYLLIIGNHM